MTPPTTRAPELTDWFPADVEPVRPGLYETKVPGYPHASVFRKWTGVLWITPNMAIKCHIQQRMWRGLRSPA